MTAPGPEQHDLIEDLNAGRITRRDFVRRSAILGLSAATISTALAACGGDEEDGADTATGGEEPTATGGETASETGGGETASATEPRSKRRNPRCPCVPTTTRSCGRCSRSNGWVRGFTIDRRGLRFSGSSNALR